MSAQLEALRLANSLAAHSLSRHGQTQAAAELRRLHEAHDWQYRMAGERLRHIEKLEAQRDALLGALKAAIVRAELRREGAVDVGVIRAAIAKAEEA